MASAERYTGLSWYGKFVTSSGTATLSGDQRSFEWTRGGVQADSTAGADAVMNEKGIREDPSFSWSGLASNAAGGTALWGTYFAPNTEGTITFSTGEGTADGKPKFTCGVIVRESGNTTPYDGMVEWTASFGGQTAVTEATWSSGA